MKFTLVRKRGIPLSTHDTEKGLSTFTFQDFLPPDLFNCRSNGGDGGDDIVRKIVWSEILRDKPIVMDILLRHPRGSGIFRRDNAIRVQSWSNKDEAYHYHNILEQMLFMSDDAKVSVYIKHVSDDKTEETFDDSTGQYLVFQEGLPIELRAECDGFSTLSDNEASNLNMNMLFNVTVIVDICDDNQERIQRAQEIAAPLKRNKVILDEGLFSDVILIAENGEEIKAHKSILITSLVMPMADDLSMLTTLLRSILISASSSVLQKMFTCGMKNSQTSRLDMTDLNENVVKAFLRFLYYGDKIAPEDDIDLAFGQLCAAHKYKVPLLEKAMIYHLTERDEDDFGVELAFKIYVFLGNTEIAPAPDLEAKIVDILKRNFDKLETLSEYRELLLKAPKSVKELSEPWARKRRIDFTPYDFRRYRFKKYGNALFGYRKKLADEFASGED